MYICIYLSLPRVVHSRKPLIYTSLSHSLTLSLSPCMCANNYVCTLRAAGREEAHGQHRCRLVPRGESPLSIIRHENSCGSNISGTVCMERGCRREHAHTHTHAHTAHTTCFPQKRKRRWWRRKRRRRTRAAAGPTSTAGATA